VRNIFKTWRVNGSRFLAETFGGFLTNGACGDVITTLTYGPSIAIDASLGRNFVVSVTDAVAFAFAAPTNTPPSGFGQEIIITIRNTSGGAHGAGTFNAVFKTSGAVPAIANGFSRSFCFRWNGTNWVELWRSAADVAN
jgi:hypothetical protein